MLSAHSVELFLKAAILQRNPTADVWARKHNLENLVSDFYSCFVDPAFEWDIPFKTEYPLDLDEAEISALKAGKTQPSILYRYPVGKEGTEWQGAYGFEPNSFLLLLDGVKTDFARIRSLLAASAR